jgi:hypothetical protein
VTAKAGLRASNIMFYYRETKRVGPTLRVVADLYANGDIYGPFELSASLSSTLKTVLT